MLTSRVLFFVSAALVSRGLPIPGDWEERGARQIELLLTGLSAA